jgi:hypothetical protein
MTFFSINSHVWEKGKRQQKMSEARNKWMSDNDLTDLKISTLKLK